MFGFSFGMVLTLALYYTFEKLYKKTKFFLFNPFMMTIVLTIVTIQLLKNAPQPFTFSYQSYKPTDAFLSALVPIATMGLAIGAYSQMNKLKKYTLVILASSIFSVTLSTILTFGLAYLFRIDKTLLNSILPKPISTAFGMEASALLSGNISLTVAFITMTGTIGNILVLPFINSRILKTHLIAKGVAIGSTSHIMGTAKALEVGDLIGNASSLALMFSGLFVLFVIVPIISYFNF